MRYIGAIAAGPTAAAQEGMTMTTRLLMLALAGTLGSTAIAQTPRAATVAVAATDRPAADKARDADRKPAELIAFAGLKPGDKVADLIPGGGYFTRIFAKVVGAKGHVYALVPSAMAERNPKAADGVKAIAAEPGYKNVSVIVAPIGSMAPAGTLDLVWTSLNYHDIYNNMPSAGADLATAAFAALKPGGVFVVVDHAAADGTGDDAAKALHRIDPAKVIAQLTAAGFVLDGRSQVLANPADAHDKPVFDPSLRGHTDQFALKFRKPKA
jgi:predicted methyltransferase